MNSVLSIFGLSHKTAPIEVREKLSIGSSQLSDALHSLIQTCDLDEVMLLSTCNRTEIYCSASQPNVMNRIYQWWEDFCQHPIDFQSHIYSHRDLAMVQHIMRVASGLDSMMIGETQILGQLKTAFEAARLNGVLGRRLTRLVESSFSVAKAVRTHTGVSSHAISVAFAAVTLAKQIFTDLSKATVVLIGAGENTELILKHLQSKQLNNIYILNRTLAHAQSLCEHFGGTALPLEELSSVLAKADIVISSVSSTTPILSKTHLSDAFKGQKRRPLLMIDLGVPRNIDQTVAEHEDVYLYSIDDLKDIVAQNIKGRQLAAKQAESFIQTAAYNFMDWLDSHSQLHSLKTLRDKADSIKQQSINEALKRLENGENAQTVVTEMAHRLTQKLLHQPTQVLKKARGEKENHKFAVAKELLGIE